ncbi:MULTISPECIES: hypothetical protein [unclassified Mesorhizobium]|uniref:hypothetical protein n=1 Tax=unclassified Mesorhizobium TaxID=325217 RepID=UPI00333A8519
MIQSSHKFKERTSFESAESVLAAILVLCLFAAILAFFHYNPELRSAIAGAFRPSDNFIATVESDPFAVLGVVSLSLVAFVATLFFLITTWSIATRSIHLLSARFLASANRSVESDKGN